MVDSIFAVSPLERRVLWTMDMVRPNELRLLDSLCGTKNFLTNSNIKFHTLSFILKHLAKQHHHSKHSDYETLTHSISSHAKCWREEVDYSFNGPLSKRYAVKIKGCSFHA
jgi:hypothetical protein